MSLGDSPIPRSEAETEAETTLRLNIGNLPHLGEPEVKDDEYVFPILISLPRVIFDQNGEEPIEVRFLAEEDVGEVRVNRVTGEVADYTDLHKIEDRIDEKEKELEHAVQKALIKSSAKAFSLLPYSAHRYTPVQDVLSELILSDTISLSRLQSMGHDEFDKYEDHIETLIDIDLVRREGDSYVAGDALTEILGQDKKPSELLNEAMVYLFEQRAEDLEMMHAILGPHLKIAGYYYRMALQSKDLPKVPQSELERHFTNRYSGEKAKQKGFKTARYLLQLEQVGLLTATTSRNERAWKGDEEIEDAILSQRKQLEPIAEVAPA